MDSKSTKGKPSSPAVCSAFISALRCVTDGAIHTTLLPRAEIARILREEAAIIEKTQEHNKLPNAEHHARPERT